MSLDLLKERFGHSVKKEADNKEKINEKLNDKFNSDGMENLKSLKYQHQEDLEEKERIIESLEMETSQLANQVLTLEKEKSTILGELNNSKWLENNIASKTKKIYEDKIKTMSYVDSSKLIPLLIEVSREKQGNEKLNWGNWLKIPENIYLFQINESIARKVFEDTNVLIDRAIDSINRRRTYAGDTPFNNYSLTFAGNMTGGSDYVSTEFNPIDYGLQNGFTVSYWVRPAEFGNHMFALGRRHNSQTNQRFTFGLNTATNAYIGVGNRKEHGFAHGMEGRDGRTTWSGNPDGIWYHWVTTFTGGSNGTLNVYRDGALVHVPQTDHDWTVTTDDTPIYFGARNVKGTGFNNGWANGLEEVAIFY